MSVAHLDVAYPSLEAFHADCEECKVNGQFLLDVGKYFLTVYGFVVSIYHPNYRPEDNAPMDIRPTAFESRLNIWRNSMELEGCTTLWQCEAIYVIDDMLPQYGPQAPNPAEHELAVSDVLGMYLMGEEL